MIKLTVALPVFNSKNIVWLAMESLCRQKSVNFEWELVICEENDANAAGRDFFFSYMTRLKAVNCQIINYIPIKSWIPLSQKWGMIGKASSKTSVIFMLQAADCFSHPARLRRTFDALIHKQFDWYQCPRGFFYHIFTEKVIIYDHKTYGQISQKLTALNMATLTEHARRLPVSDKKKGVDGWFLSTIRSPRMYVDRNHSWKMGMDTQGLNNISKKRARYFDTTVAPFISTSWKLANIVPPDIVEMILATRNRLLDSIEKQEVVAVENRKQKVINCMDDVQENMVMPFVYVWVKGPQVWNELAISIRSVRKFYTGKYQIFVVGDSPGINGVVHIPCNIVKGFAYCRSMDIANKLNVILRTESIGNNFVLMYDDIVLLKPVDYRVLKLTVAHDKVENAQTYFRPGSGVNPSGRWQELFKQTMWMLQKRGLPTYNYETHLPRLLNKGLLKEVMDRFKILQTPCLVNTLYYNSYVDKPEIELNHINKIKASAYRPYDNDKSLSNELRGKTYLNYDNAGLNELLKKHIMKIVNS